MPIQDEPSYSASEPLPKWEPTTTQNADETHDMPGHVIRDPKVVRAQVAPSSLDTELYDGELGPVWAEAPNWEPGANDTLVASRPVCLP